jgi:hypothetical protein
MIVFGLTTKISSTKVGDFFCSNAARVCAPAAGAMELVLQVTHHCMTLAKLFLTVRDR